MSLVPARKENELLITVIKQNMYCIKDGQKALEMFCL